MSLCQAYHSRIERNMLHFIYKCKSSNLFKIIHLMTLFLQEELIGTFLERWLSGMKLRPYRINVSDCFDSLEIQRIQDYSNDKMTMSMWLRLRLQFCYGASFNWNIVKTNCIWSLWAWFRQCCVTKSEKSRKNHGEQNIHNRFLHQLYLWSIKLIHWLSKANDQLARWTRWSLGEIALYRYKSETTKINNKHV
jgi:hypothetical protein